MDRPPYAISLVSYEITKKTCPDADPVGRRRQRSGTKFLKQSVDMYLLIDYMSKILACPLPRVYAMFYRSLEGQAGNCFASCSACVRACVRAECKSSQIQVAFPCPFWPKESFPFPLPSKVLSSFSWLYRYAIFLFGIK